MRHLPAFNLQLNTSQIPLSPSFLCFSLKRGSSLNLQASKYQGPVFFSIVFSVLCFIFFQPAKTLNTQQVANIVTSHYLSVHCFLSLKFKSQKAYACPYETTELALNTKIDQTPIGKIDSSFPLLQEPSWQFFLKKVPAPN